MSAGSSCRNVHVWDVASGRALHKLPGHLDGHDGPLRSQGTRSFGRGAQIDRLLSEDRRRLTTREWTETRRGRPIISACSTSRARTVCVPGDSDNLKVVLREGERVLRILHSKTHLPSKSKIFGSPKPPSSTRVALVHGVERRAQTLPRLVVRAPPPANVLAEFQKRFADARADLSVSRGAPWRPRGPSPSSRAPPRPS